MKPYQRGDVVLIDVPIPESGHVQGGYRPWVIVQNNVGNEFSPTSLVCPLTTKLKRLEMPTHVAITWDRLTQSMVECEQVRVIDVTPEWKYVCSLPKEIMVHVDEALKNAFFYGEGSPDKTLKENSHAV
jgi:mRNA interferase MazF